MSDEGKWAGGFLLVLIILGVYAWINLPASQKGAVAAIAPPAATAAEVKTPEVHLDLGDWHAHSDAISGTVKNRSGVNCETAYIEFNLYDSHENLVGNTFDTISNLGPGQMWKFRAPVFANQYARAHLTKLEGK